MSILFTGFEPFGGAALNPSWEAVSRLPDTLCGCTVHRLCLPVVFGQAADMVCNAIRDLRPEVVICVGVASGRKGVTPELVALNYRMARIPDNAGQSFSGTPILPGGETAYMTALPVQQMAEALRAAGIPAYVSLSAGAYVCNDVYYAVLRTQEELGHQGLFVHVPDPDVADADTLARALSLIAGTLFA